MAGVEVVDVEVAKDLMTRMRSGNLDEEPVVAPRVPIAEIEPDDQQDGAPRWVFPGVFPRGGFLVLDFSLWRTQSATSVRVRGGSQIYETTHV